MTSSDCIRGWKHCDLKHPLTTGKPFTGNHLAIDKCLIIFNSGSAKNLQIACKVTDCVLRVDARVPFHSLCECKWFLALMRVEAALCVSFFLNLKQTTTNIPSVLKWKKDPSIVVKLGQRVSGEFAIYSQALWTALLRGPETWSPLGRICCVLRGRFMTVYVWLGI